MLDFGKEHAPIAFPTNDEWQQWRGRVDSYKWVLDYRNKVNDLYESLDEAVFDDEQPAEEADTNTLED